VAEAGSHWRKPVESGVKELFQAANAATVILLNITRSALHTVHGNRIAWLSRTLTETAWMSTYTELSFQEHGTVFI